MSSDGGNFFEKTFEDAANVFVQTFTGGAVGFQDGGFQRGVTTNAAVEGVKEITGAKAAEEANAAARQQFEQAQKDAEQARLDAQAGAARDQITQSRLAGRSRTTGGSGGRTTPNTFSSSSLGGMERDFLGL